jgi:hypothetical protein
MQRTLRPEIDEQCQGDSNRALELHIEASQHWKQRFVETGGASYLVQMLLLWPTDVSRSDARRRRCLALLLRVINLCVLGIDDQQLDSTTTADTDKPSNDDENNNNNADTVKSGDTDDAERSDDSAPVNSRDFFRAVGGATATLSLPLKSLQTDAAAISRKLLELVRAAATPPEQQQQQLENDDSQATVPMTDGDNDDVEEEAAESEEEGADSDDEQDDQQRQQEERVEDEKRTQSLIKSALAFFSAVADAPDSDAQRASEGGVLAVPGVDAWLRDTLLAPPSALVRRAVAVGLHNVCRGERGTPLRHWLFTQLLTLVDSLSHTDDQCAEFYMLVARLARDGAQAAGGDAQLLRWLTERVRAQPIVELRGLEVVDRVLCGMLSLLATLLRRAAPPLRAELAADVASGGAGLLDELFYRCLFDTPTPDNHAADAPPKCKSSLARTRAFAALRRLAVDNPPVLDALLARLQPLHPVCFHLFVCRWYESKTQHLLLLRPVILENIGITLRH